MDLTRLICCTGYISYNNGYLSVFREIYNNINFYRFVYFNNNFLPLKISILFCIDGFLSGIVLNNSANIVLVTIKDNNIQFHEIQKDNIKLNTNINFYKKIKNDK